MPKNTTLQKTADGGLSSLVANHLARLDRPDFPKSGICSHLGISFSCGEDHVGMSSFQGRLLVTVYRGDSQYQAGTDGRTEIVGYPKKEHKRKRQAIARATGSPVIDEWNGSEGSTGISVCLDRPCPESLSVAIANYRALPNVFDLSDTEKARFTIFNDWLNALEHPTEEAKINL